MAAQNTVTIGGRELVCSPLALKDLKRFSEILHNRNADSPFDSMTEMAEVILMSLKKKTPDLTMEFIEDNVTLMNYYEVVNAVMSASGLRAATPAPESAGPQKVGEANPSASA